MNDSKIVKTNINISEKPSWKNNLKYILKDLRYKHIEGNIKKLTPIFEKYAPNLRKLYSKIKITWYRGENKICPCCGGYFRKFFPHGKGLRTSAMCPRCGSLERHRLIFLYLKQRTKFFSKKYKVLHFSPAPILQEIFKKLPNLEYITVDLDSPLTMYNMDIMNLIFDDSSFDVIICCHVLEHVANDLLAMKELYRVLKLDGWAIIQVPIDFHIKKTFEDPKIISPKDRTHFFGHYSHVRLYGTDYINRLKEAGFKVKVDDFFLKIRNDEIIKKFGLNEKENIFYCSK